MELQMGKEMFGFRQDTRGPFRSVERHSESNRRNSDLNLLTKKERVKVLTVSERIFGCRSNATYCSTIVTVF